MGLARWDKESIRIPFSCKFWVSYQFWWVFLVGKDVQIGQRMITISTVGVPNTIRKLASHKLQSTLAVRYVIYNRKTRIFVSQYYVPFTDVVCLWVIGHFCWSAYVLLIELAWYSESCCCNLLFLAQMYSLRVYLFHAAIHIFCSRGFRSLVRLM